MNTKLLSLTIFLLLTLSLIWWLTLHSVQKNLAKSNVNTSQTDAFIQDIEYRKMDKTGVPINHIHAETAVHYIDNDEYVFTNPDLKIIDSSKKLWKIHASHGKSTNKETIVNLSGNVTIRNSEKLAIETNSLTYHRDNNYAVTEDPLIITQLGNTIRATGAKLDFQKGCLKLISKVEGLYAAEEK